MRSMAGMGTVVVVVVVVVLHIHLGNSLGMPCLLAVVERERGKRR